MTTRPGDDAAAAARGLGNLRASHADREQAIDTVKAAFVLGQLTAGELMLSWPRSPPASPRGRN